MLVFSTAGGPQEMEPPEKETNLARTRPTRKLADRLKGDGMHIPFKKVLVPALIASTLAVGALGTPSIVFGKHKTHTFATLPAKASEVKVKPVSGSDALEITIGQKKHTISAVGSLSDIGRLTFSDNFEQLHLGGAGSIQGAIFMPEGVLHLASISEANNDVSVRLQPFTPDQPMDMDLVRQYQNGARETESGGRQLVVQVDGKPEYRPIGEKGGLFAMLSHNEIVIIDETVASDTSKMTVFSYDFTKNLKDVKTKNLSVEFDLAVGNRQIKIFRNDGLKAFVIGVSIDDNRLLEPKHPDLSIGQR